jgi:hypothetical protein
MAARATDALAFLRHDLDEAVRHCALGGHGWIGVAEGAAFVAEAAADEIARDARDPGLPDDDRYPAGMAARAYRRVAGLCRAAAAAPTRQALAVLEEARRRLG